MSFNLQHREKNPKFNQLAKQNASLRSLFTYAHTPSFFDIIWWDTIFVCQFSFPFFSLLAMEKIGKELLDNPAKIQKIYWLLIAKKKKPGPARPSQVQRFRRRKKKGKTQKPNTKKKSYDFASNFLHIVNLAWLENAHFCMYVYKIQERKYYTNSDMNYVSTLFEKKKPRSQIQK